MNRRDDRSKEIIIGFVLLLIGFAAMGWQFTNAIVLPLIVIGLVMMFRQLDAQRRSGSSSSQRQSARTVQVRRSNGGSEYQQPGRERIYRHALAAIENAGMDPDEVSVLTTDIGVMAFRGDQEPVIHRTRPVLDDVDYIQPFVELRLPSRAEGNIRFEIVDSDGQVVFVRDEHHPLERGRNLVTPAARLPIHDAQAMHRPWELRVSADGVLLASHSFRWDESTSSVVRRHLSEDGEISSALRAALSESRLERVSLDDLLAEQDEQQEAQSRAQRR